MTKCRSLHAGLHFVCRRLETCGPSIETIGQSGSIYARYGGFTKSTVTDPRTGREVADIRGQIAPPWVRDPF